MYISMILCMFAVPMMVTIIAILVICFFSYGGSKVFDTVGEFTGDITKYKVVEFKDETNRTYFVPYGLTTKNKWMPILSGWEGSFTSNRYKTYEGARKNCIACAKHFGYEGFDVEIKEHSI